MGYLSARPHRCRDTAIVSRLNDIKENTKMMADNSDTTRPERQIYRELSGLYYGYDKNIVVVGLSESQVMSRVHRAESLTTVDMYCQFCPKCPKGTRTPALSTTASTHTSNSAKPETISPSSSTRLSTRSAIGCNTTMRLECSSMLKLPERRIQDAFRQAHDTEFSKPSTWRIIHSLGLTWKVVGRRAFHIKELDVFHFVGDLSHINGSHQNSSSSTRCHLTTEGWFANKATPSERNPRISILPFIGANGIIDYFNTERMFDRLAFSKCCQDLVYAEKEPIHQYPGPDSIWIMDGLPSTVTMKFLTIYEVSVS
ncbi:Hypothetical protein PHPALM_14480 [Phytophthora palmivora]|uniref:Uncharacterized protein n=1 Tax=Phytophthora palmivora TaxID=4796 RepID=A0A2P4XUK1_9STRA|nr:Hypothetical protein PHPALM_14480 [Phytophthora palmivora]